MLNFTYAFEGMDKLLKTVRQILKHFTTGICVALSQPFAQTDWFQTGTLPAVFVHTHNL
jgi:hypothetical protein